MIVINEGEENEKLYSNRVFPNCLVKIKQNQMISFGVGNAWSLPSHTEALLKYFVLVSDALD